MVRHDYDHPTRSEVGGAKIEEVYGEATRDCKYYLRTAKTKGFCSSAKFTGLKTKEIGPGKPPFPRSKSLGRLRLKPGRRGSEVTNPILKKTGTFRHGIAPAICYYSSDADPDATDISYYSSDDTDDSMPIC